MLNALIARSDNLVARLDLARLAAKRGDGAALQKTLAPLTASSASWPPEVRERFRAVEQAASSTSPRAAAPAIAFLKNVLVRVPDYRRSLAQVSTPREEVGEPFERFVTLKNPDPQPAPPDGLARSGRAPPHPLGGDGRDQRGRAVGCRPRQLAR